MLNESNYGLPYFLGLNADACGAHHDSYDVGIPAQPEKVHCQTFRMYPGVRMVEKFDRLV